MSGSLRISHKEMHQAFETGTTPDRYPPILKTEQVLEMLGIAGSTLDEWIAKGRLKDTYRRRGKHRFFWRDRVIDRVFNGPDWSDQ